jgi:hypothetical protein
MSRIVRFLTVLGGEALRCGIAPRPAAGRRNWGILLRPF